MIDWATIHRDMAVVLDDAPELTPEMVRIITDVARQSVERELIAAVTNNAPQPEPTLAELTEQIDAAMRDLAVCTGRHPAPPPTFYDTLVRTVAPLPPLMERVWDTETPLLQLAAGPGGTVMWVPEAGAELMCANGERLIQVACYNNSDTDAAAFTIYRSPDGHITIPANATGTFLRPNRSSYQVDGTTGVVSELMLAAVPMWGTLSPEEAEHRRAEEIERIKERDEARDRSIVLLKEWLTPAQLELFDAPGVVGREKHFDVTGSKGGHYRIFMATTFNVTRFDREGEAIDRMCFVPVGLPWVGDIMLAQKITLEHDERAALKVANHEGGEAKWKLIPGPDPRSKKDREAPKPPAMPPETERADLWARLWRSIRTMPGM